MFFYNEPDPPPLTQIVSYVTMSLNALTDASNTESYPGSGSIWYNLLDNTQNLYLANGTVFTSSADNIKSMQMDGVNDYIDAPHLPPSTISSQPNTITFWIKRNTDSNGVIISNLYGRWVYPGAYYQAHGFSVMFAGSNQSSVACQVHDVNGNYYYTHTTGLVPNNGKFYNITIRNRFEVFINGINANSVGTNSRGTVNFGALSNQAFRIGSNLPNTNNWYLAANVAAFQFYDRALTDQEIVYNFSGSKSSFGW